MLLLQDENNKQIHSGNTKVSLGNRKRGGEGEMPFNWRIIAIKLIIFSLFYLGKKDKQVQPYSAISSIQY